MTTFTVPTTLEIDTSAAEAWRVFGEGFGTWADWAPGIDSSTLLGPLAKDVRRVNVTPSLGRVTQQLVRYEPDERALSYTMVEGLPPMFTVIRNDWVIEELEGGRCRLVGEGVFELAEAAAPMRDKIRGKMGVTLEVFAQALRERLTGAQPSV
jgi:hypothetical protein